VRAVSLLAVVVSRADSASEHVGRRLRELGSWTERTDDSRPDGEGGGTVYRSTDTPVTLELRTFDPFHLRLDHPEAAFSTEPDALVFASRHSGDTGPLLTCHFTGNFGEAEYGGDDHAFAPAAPGLQRALVSAFDAYAPEGYEVGIECTHHGPTAVGVPSIFAELGSDESEWDDPEGARAVARAIRSLATDAVTGEPATDAVTGEPATDAVTGEPATDAVTDESTADAATGESGTDAITGESASQTVEEEPPTRHVFGVGGGHYAPRFERLLRETAWGVGHIASNWQLSELGDPAAGVETLERAMAASDASVVVAGEGGDDAAAALDAAGHRVVSETWVREVDDRPLAVVDAVESDICSVADGLRFGTVEVGDPSGYAVVDLPSDLLDAARRVDTEATRRAVFDRAVAVETDENGNRVGERAALPVGEAAAAALDGDQSLTDSDTPAAYDDLIDRLVDLLTREFETVERRDGRVRAERESFDPERARALGVPEGPKFGTLSNGVAVEVDGEMVTPGDVQSVEIQTFEL
jgi:D-aminoacyl-tRNA deacylase